MALDSSINIALTIKDGSNTIGYNNDVLTASKAEGQTGYYIIAAAASDVAITLGPLATAEMVYLSSTQALTAKFNGSATAIAFKKLLIDTASVTALTVSNPGGTDAKLNVYMIGS